MEQFTIKQIEQKLSEIEDPKDPFLQNCKNDPRKGVKLILQKWERKHIVTENLRKQYYEMMSIENDLFHQGIEYIAGVDEVGRGPLAGPVVAAAVILKKDAYIPGINDSKKLSESKREQLFSEITEQAISIGLGIVPANLIDEVNIYEATKIAMKKAIQNLSVTPNHILVDAMKIPVQIPQTSIIKGDAKSVSIAASSIIAKVTRDRYMKRLATEFPGYGFEKHMGYGTFEHMEALQLIGITNEHRKSFAPIRNILMK